MKKLALLFIVISVIATKATTQEIPEFLNYQSDTSWNVAENNHSLLDNLFNNNDILTIDQAFQIKQPIVADGILINILIADRHYLYKNKLKFSLSDNTNVSISMPNLPKGTIKNDSNFGKMSVIYKKINTILPVHNKSNLPETVKLIIHYQGCADKGICYPPAKKIFNLKIPALTNTSAIVATNNIENHSSKRSTKFNLNHQDNRIINSLESGNLWLIIVAFFAAGLLLAFTPCIFPMIPILSSLIVGQQNTTTKKSFILSLIYILSVAFVYVVVGVLSGIIGESIQAWFQKPWVLLLFGSIIVMMALSMFGLFELQIPSFIQNKANYISNKQKNGTYIGAIIMGMLSALIVGACSTPVLAVAIGYIGKTGNPILGGIALLMMSLGMGLPLLIIGTSAGKFLPKNGAWMDTVKSSFGVLMLMVALYIVEPVVPVLIIIGLWSVLLISTSVYMGAFNNNNLTKIQKFSKSLGLILFIYGVIMLVGLASGKATLLQPLKGFVVNNIIANKNQSLQFKHIKKLSELDAELQNSAHKNQFTMVDFYADWCKSCIELENFTFNDKLVTESLNGVKLLQIDVSSNNENDKKMLQRFHINGPPAILFFDKNAVEKQNYRLNGFFSPQDFVLHIQSALF